MLQNVGEIAERQESRRRDRESQDHDAESAEGAGPQQGRRRRAVKPLGRSGPLRRGRSSPASAGDPGWSRRSRVRRRSRRERKPGPGRRGRSTRGGPTTRREWPPFLRKRSDLAIDVDLGADIDAAPTCGTVPSGPNRGRLRRRKLSRPQARGLVDNADALPTTPQGQKQQQPATRKWPKVSTMYPVQSVNHHSGCTGGRAMPARVASLARSLKSKMRPTRSDASGKGSGGRRSGAFCSRRQVALGGFIGDFVRVAPRLQRRVFALLRLPTTRRCSGYDLGSSGANPVGMARPPILSFPPCGRRVEGEGHAGYGVHGSTSRNGSTIFRPATTRPCCMSSL